MNKKIWNFRNHKNCNFFASISVLLMFIKVPLPFAPTFMEMDIAELPALIGGFAMGPLAGFLIVCIKLLLNIIIMEQKLFMWRASNLIVSSAFVLTTAFIYKHNKSKKSALLGLVIGSITMSLVLHKVGK